MGRLNRAGLGRPAPVELHQREREFAELLDIYREEQPTTVLEIGVAQGGTLWSWLREARDDERVVVVAVDTFTTYEDNRDDFPYWAPSNVELHVIEGRSDATETIDAVFEIAQSYDWVFIDGDHSLSAVTFDWLTYGRSAHTAVFHDIYADPRYHPEIKVRVLWDELRDEYETREIIEDATLPWGGFGVVWPNRYPRETLIDLLIARSLDGAVNPHGPGFVGSRA